MDFMRSLIVLWIQQGLLYDLKTQACHRANIEVRWVEFVYLARVYVQVEQPSLESSCCSAQAVQVMIRLCPGHKLWTNTCRMCNFLEANFGVFFFFWICEFTFCSPVHKTLKEYSVIFTTSFYGMNQKK